jgi:DNA-binding MarR family transcriptional regulator
MAKAKQIGSFEDFPGHQIRRLQQIAVGIFMDEAAEFNVTPVQFALLFATSKDPGLDQRTLASKIGFDTSTIGAVIDRLEARGLVQRNASLTDKRVRLMTLTKDGSLLLEAVMPAMARAQERMLAPLPKADQQCFMSMIKTVIDANGVWSRAAKEAA